MTTKFHIPEGINYDCTGCGKCCSGWAVPMTSDDYARVLAVNWGSYDERYKGKSLFRPMSTYEKKFTTYTHAIKPAEDGNCPFLVDNLCFIHKHFGGEYKPGMCQLFPYSFNETPSGVYTTVSFVSMAVIYNTGSALTEQEDVLARKYADFKRLFPELKPSWDNVLLTVGQALNWQDYLNIEAVLLDCLKDESLSLEERMLKGSDHLLSLVAKSSSPNSSPSPNTATQAKLKHLDRHLLAALHKIYYPVKPLGKGEGDFSVARFLYQFIYGNAQLPTASKNYTLEELNAFSWTVGDKDIDNLLYRYIYSRIFSKFYFGGGFGQISLIAGFHHLIMVLLLIKLQAKAYALNRGAPKVAMVDLVPAVKFMEKRLGETTLNGYAAGLWELLMFSPQRIRRLINATEEHKEVSAQTP